jgi:ribosome-binding ATPase YchF (GTP1/OBG family)
LVVIVLREFSDPSVPWHAEPNPARDYDAILTEMIVADLERIERRLERLAKEPNAKKPGTAEYLQATLFERMKPELEAGRPISAVAMDEAETAVAQSFQFLTDKPFVLVVNADEGQVEPTPWERSLAEAGVSVVRLCAVLERDLAGMSEEERREFIEALGLKETARDRLVRAVYETLDLVTFYTAGEKDTRAWPLRKGATAWKAADTIHSDIARGFIRAEVVSYADFEALGSVKECYRQGRMRLEGKEYVVQDGDILHIRHKS